MVKLRLRINGWVRTGRWTRIGKVNLDGLAKKDMPDMNQMQRQKAIVNVLNVAEWNMRAVSRSVSSATGDPVNAATVVYTSILILLAVRSLDESDNESTRSGV